MESWLFFCGYPDAQFKGYFHRSFVLLQFVFIIQYRDHILKSAVQQGGDPAGIRLLLEAITDDIGILCDLLAFDTVS